MKTKKGKFWQLAIVAGALALMPGAANAAEIESVISHGGRLYDKWFGENKAEKPTTDHAAYPIKGGEYGKDASWRCKECHGWDYVGKDGGYAKGKHATGIVGISAAAGKDPAAIAAMLRAEPHGYKDNQLSQADVEALALFVSKGQVDMSKYLDAEGKPKGDAARGEVYFNTICAGCHGTDGKKIKEGPLGPVASNAREMLHKVLNGQPGESMPSLRALDRQIAVDIVAHLQTLPK
jgi:thiosulfate dehydrogenase